MMNQPAKNDQPATSLQSPLSEQIRAEFDLGIALAADPVNARRSGQALRETTIYSPWLTRACRVCKDRFRLGDQVRLCPECGEPYHDDDQYNLRCWQKQFGQGGICHPERIDRFGEQERVLAGCGFSLPMPLPEE